MSNHISLSDSFKIFDGGMSGRVLIEPGGLPWQVFCDRMSSSQAEVQAAAVVLTGLFVIYGRFSG